MPYITSEIACLFTGALIRRAVILVATLGVVAAAPLPLSATDYYISNSTGNDGYNGQSSGTPWKTFNAVNTLTLQPGDRVLLKSGDTWNQELHLTGRGSAGNYIQLSSYGSGPNPTIQRGGDMANDRCVVIEGAHYWKISSIDCTQSKLGIYLRYIDNYFNSDVQISYCNFSNMTDQSVDPASHNYEFSWSSGIWLGGTVSNIYAQNTVLDGLFVKHCTFINTGQGIGNNWYWPTVNKSRVKNVILEDLYGSSLLGGLFALSYVDGGHAWRCSARYSGGYFQYGTTGSFLQYCKNFQVDNCDFGWTDQTNCPDGVGFDFEGANEYCSFTNNVCHNNDGAGILVMNSGGDNIGLTISGNTFYDNVRNPYASHGAYDILCYQATNTGTLSNNGIYRSGATAHLSPNWDGFTQSGNRLNTWSSVSSRPLGWEFNTAGNAEGWSGFNQWNNVSVSSGALRGSSSGVDPYGYSSSTWVNRWDYPYVKVRMSQTQGSVAQVFFITETDTVWNGAKSLNFNIIPDAVMRDYSIDLRNCPAFKGVVTQIRLDPTTVSGSTMAIDYVRSSGAP